MSKQSRSSYQFFQEASLSQKLADKIPAYVDLAGSDPKISKKIGRLKIFADLGWIPKEDAEIMLRFLNMDRMAAFATSEKVNEITKMGMQMPKAEDIISSFDKKEK